MTFATLPDRAVLANRIRKSRHELATAVNERFFSNHPDWRQKYGDRGVRLGYEDAGFHLDFLAAAIECGEPKSFASYAEWARRMLDSRNIGAEFLAESIDQVGQVVQSMMTEAEQRSVQPFIDTALDVCRTTSDDPSTIGSQASVFVQALLSGNRSAASNVMWEFSRSGTSLEQLYLDVIQPAMYEIGRLWQINRITVAREHMATVITQFVMAQLYPLISQTRERELGHVVIAGVQGELHQIGPLMVADLLEADGWTVEFLGSNMPHDGILKAIEETRAHILGISATMLFNLQSATQLIAETRLRFPDVKIIVGGAAFRYSPDYWREAGADAYAADLRAAREMARSWTGH